METLDINNSFSRIQDRRLMEVVGPFGYGWPADHFDDGRADQLLLQSSVSAVPSAVVIL